MRRGVVRRGVEAEGRWCEQSAEAVAVGVGGREVGAVVGGREGREGREVGSPVAALQ